jgi:glycosyltransferase involved in cell wall biosynthesis
MGDVNFIPQTREESAQRIGQRPLVTFALFAYNQERYIREAVEGAFSQTYEPLEIILSDDCSTDRTFEIMQEMAESYRGPHRVVLNRNSNNLNVGDHVNVVCPLAVGELIILAAGDDVSMTNRTERLVSRWISLGRPSAVLCSDFEAMNIASQPIELDEAVFRGAYHIRNMARGDIRVLGATTAVTKDVFSAFPPMDPTVCHEDRVLPFRALLLGGVVTLVDEKLVRYRVEGGISRCRVNSGREFLYEYMPVKLSRLLPDALQRLADLERRPPANVALRSECLSTIADHRAQIELLRLRGPRMEFGLMRWLLKGARPLPLIKLYLKIRSWWIL